VMDESLGRDGDGFLSLRSREEKREKRLSLN
jgi:hypothetical protein